MGRKSRFSAQARAAAVRLAREPGNSFASVGRDLGVHQMTVRRWAWALEAEEHPAARQARAEHAELVSLRQRLRVLEEEREILAKAAAFLARETGRSG
jgi:transposase